MIQEHLLGHGRALALAQQLQNPVFLAGHAQWPLVHLDRAGVEIHR